MIAWVEHTFAHGDFYYTISIDCHANQPWLLGFFQLLLLLCQFGILDSSGCRLKVKYWEEECHLGKVFKGTELLAINRCNPLTIWISFQNVMSQRGFFSRMHTYIAAAALKIGIRILFKVAEYRGSYQARRGGGGKKKVILGPLRTAELWMCESADGKLGWIYSSWKTAPLMLNLLKSSMFTIVVVELHATLMR